MMVLWGGVVGSVVLLEVMGKVVGLLSSVAWLLVV